MTVDFQIYGIKREKAKYKHSNTREPFIGFTTGKEMVRLVIQLFT